MLKMAKIRCYDILHSFKSDSSGLPNTAKVRAIELADSPSAKYKWFLAAHKMITVSGRQRNRYYEIYANKSTRSIWDEPARISLSGANRKD